MNIVDGGGCTWLNWGGSVQEICCTCLTRGWPVQEMCCICLTRGGSVIEMCCTFLISGDPYKRFFASTCLTRGVPVQEIFCKYLSYKRRASIRDLLHLSDKRWASAKGLLYLSDKWRTNTKDLLKVPKWLEAGQCKRFVVSTCLTRGGPVQEICLYLAILLETGQYKRFLSTYIFYVEM